MPVLRQPRRVTLVDRRVIEAEELVVGGVHVHAKGPAGVKAGHVTILLRRPQVDLDHRLAVMVLEVAIDLLGIFQIGVFPLAAKDAGRNTVALKQPAAQPAPAGPVVDRRDAPLMHMIAADNTLVRVARRRANGENPHPVALVLGAVAVENRLLESVEADEGFTLGASVPGPQGLDVHRLQTCADLTLR